ncbi:MAG: tetratricopeptide repeat protein [Blastocatellia bacterium]
MKSRNLVYLLTISLLLTFSATAQEQAKPPADPELEKVKELSRQAWQESDQFVKAGNKAGDAAYPGRKWAATLWEYREQHPGTPAAAHATGEALHLLVHAELYTELAAKADALKPDDGAWKRVLGVLMEAANHKKEYDYALNKATYLLQSAPDKDVKRQAQYTVGEALWKKGATDQAVTAFRKVIADYPNTSLARQAESNIYEIEALNTGLPAPLFAFKAANGDPVSLADLKGKVVLLHFWASW